MDNIKSAAKAIREALLKVDFGLKDKFCDSEELKHSWSTTRMADELISFFLYCSISKTNITQTISQWGWFREYSQQEWQMS